MPRLFFRIVAALSALLPSVALAQAPAIGNPCPIPVLPCGGGGIEGIQRYATDMLFPSARIFFIALALGHLFYAGYRLISEASDENSRKEAKTTYSQIIYACAIVSFASFLVDAFGSTAEETLINPEPLAEGFSNVIFYLKMAIAGILSFTMVVQGMRLILVVNDDLNEKSRAEKNLVNAFFGVAAMLLADTFVRAFLPGSGTVGLSDEVRGFANFLLEIFAGLAVFSFIVAGIFLIFSFDESLRERAKKTCITAVIATAIILSSYVLVNYFLSL